MCNSPVYLIVLAACLAASSARPADIVARVPSDFYYGTKWVLFRDSSIPNPPANVIQHENNVQVLPSYQHQQHQQQHQQLALPLLPVGPSHIEAAPVLADYDSEVIESKSAHPTPAPFFEVTSFGVTSVPATSVHVEGPAYYLRKKKNVQ